ncbi:MAG: hypothetical protein KDB27_15650 [Planctomycetales bacterium]|nr:hypothetical protein [Planctomycetales bacterium]
MARQRQKRGYVLLMALLVLCLAITILTGLSRYSMGVALAANTATSRLQEKWGTYTIRNSLSALEKQALGRKLTVNLGRLRYDISFQNECAKLNVNQLVKWQGQQTLVKACQELSGEYNLALAPNDFSENRRIREPFESWGQVFDFETISGKDNYETLLAERTQHLTLWGSGKLNWYQASDRSLSFAVGEIVAPARAGQLLELRKKQTAFEAALRETNVSVREFSDLKRFVSEDAKCLRADIAVFEGATRIAHYTSVEREIGQDVWIAW